MSGEVLSYVVISGKVLSWTHKFIPNESENVPIFDISMSNHGSSRLHLGYKRRKIAKFKTKSFF
jgi:hypothetical protein